MIFSIQLKLGSRVFHMYCERTEMGQTFERFMVWPRDNPRKWIILQNNRPLLRKKLNLKSKRYNWKIIHGTIKDQNAFDKMIEIIESYLETDGQKN
ncbi:MAG: hypothetical protein ACXVBJ_11855 [Flavisolibacter sp.]